MNLDDHVSILNNKIKDRKKEQGIFFTPQWLINIMCKMINNNLLSSEIKILEPACGICQFLNGLKLEKYDIYNKSKKIGIEKNIEIIEYAKKVNVSEDFEIISADYLLWNSNELFDVIIGNPPYGIPSDSEHYTLKIDNELKNIYKNHFETWYGKYNVYGAFIEKSIKLLKDNGQLIFIIPATFMILDEFKKLRNFLSENGKTEIIYMGNDVFSPDANVTTVILKFIKSQIIKNQLELYDYKNNSKTLITKKNNWNGDIITFSTEFTKYLDKYCSFKLDDVYNIRISPRTPEIKQNKEIIKINNYDGKLLPILNGKNLKIGKVIYDPKSGYWIDENKKCELRYFFDKPHIVVGLGYRGEKQLGAAIDYKAYPWMGDIYHLLRKQTIFNEKFDLTDEEIINFLNSEIIKKYINDTFRDIIYHFNIIRLRQIPLSDKNNTKII